tara:strand:- start:3123 stop:3239 length:117 start_codon:yes stop_codon:yes gene_type:complete
MISRGLVVDIRIVKTCVNIIITHVYKNISYAVNNTELN